MNTDLQDMERQAFFNQRASTWLDNFYHNPDTDRHDLHFETITDIIDDCNIKPGARVLDAGCGSGVLVPYILPALSAEGRLYEVDYAEKMIAANRTAHRDDRITFICSDIMDIPFEADFFDCVICFACFPHFRDQKAALKTLSRVLKPGGRLTIAHLMSADEIAGHHRTETAVSRDRLPGKKEMKQYIHHAGLKLRQLTDRPGIYFLSAEK